MNYKYETYQEYLREGVVNSLTDVVKSKNLITGCYILSANFGQTIIFKLTDEGLQIYKRLKGNNRHDIRRLTDFNVLKIQASEAISIINYYLKNESELINKYKDEIDKLITINISNYKSKIRLIKESGVNFRNEMKILNDKYDEIETQIKTNYKHKYLSYI